MRVELGDRLLDLSTRQIRTPEGIQTLSSREAAVLEVLVAADGRPVARDVLVGLLGDGERAVDFAVRRIRTKLERESSRPVHLLTVRGTGYRLARTPDPAGAGRSALRLGERWVDLETGHVDGPVGTPAVTLTELELRVLGVLLRARGEAVGRDQLLAEVWNRGPGGRSRRPDAVISSLRGKLEQLPDQPRYLVTERGRGWRVHRELARLQPGGSFVGRSAELSTLDGLVRSGRIVAVTGPGGIGKSRLVREWALAAAPSARWVELDEIRRPISAVLAIARVLGIDPGAPTHLQAGLRLLLAHLRGRQTVLIFDGIDGIDGVDAIVGGLADSGIELRLVLTSRRRCPIPGTQRLPLGPLSGPEARRLYLERSVAPGIQGGPTVDLSVVDALDRIPLAIEIVACRPRASGMGAGGGGGLSAAVAQGWRALPDPSRRALVACSAFVAPFDRRAFEEVCGSGVLLDDLVDRSLLTIVEGPQRRWFRPWPAVRALAAERLGDEARAAHAAWLSARARELMAQIDGPDHEQVRDEINLVLDDLLEATTWLVRAGSSSALQIIHLLLRCLWLPHGLFAHYLDHVPPSPGAWLLRANLLRWEGRLSEAEAALRLAERAGLEPGAWGVRRLRCGIALDRSDGAALADALPEAPPADPLLWAWYQAHALWLGDARAEAIEAMADVANGARRGRVRTIEQLATMDLAAWRLASGGARAAVQDVLRSLALARAMGEIRGEVYALCLLADVRLELDDDEGVRATLERLGEVAGVVGELFRERIVHTHRAMLALRAGRFADALRHGRRVRRVAEAQENGRDRLLAIVIELLALSGQRRWPEVRRIAREVDEIRGDLQVIVDGFTALADARLGRTPRFPEIPRSVHVTWRSLLGLLGAEVCPERALEIEVEDRYVRVARRVLT